MGRHGYDNYLRLNILKISQGSRHEGEGEKNPLPLVPGTQTNLESDVFMVQYGTS